MGRRFKFEIEPEVVSRLRERLRIYRQNSLVPIEIFQKILADEGMKVNDETVRVWLRRHYIREKKYRKRGRWWIDVNSVLEFLSVFKKPSMIVRDNNG